MKIKFNKINTSYAAVLLVTTQMATVSTVFCMEDVLPGAPKLATTAFLNSRIKDTENAKKDVVKCCDPYKEKIAMYSCLGIRVERRFGGWTDLGSNEYTFEESVLGTEYTIKSYLDLFSINDFIRILREKNYADFANQLEKKMQEMEERKNVNHNFLLSLLLSGF